MKKCFPCLCGALFLIAGTVPVAPAQFSASGNPTQSTIPELASIVVLCANDSQSSFFKREWGAYVGAKNLQGLDLDELKRFLDASGLRAIVAGGVGSMEDIRKLKNYEKDGVAGVIVGRALYEGRVDLEEALELC